MKYRSWVGVVLGSMAVGFASACGSSGDDPNKTNIPPAMAATGNVTNGGIGGSAPVAMTTGGVGGGAPLSVGGSGGSGGSAPTTANAGSGSVADMMGTGGSAGAAGVQSMPDAGEVAPTPTDCGMRTGMRGKTSRSVMVGGVARTFIAYLPQMASPTTPLPFVYVFHGATQTGQFMYDMTEYSKLADSEGIAVVFPDGQDSSSAAGAGSLAPWSVTDGPAVCGAGALVSNPNPVDFDFVDAIWDDVKQDQCLDSDHIFATGFSMGGYFSHHIACDRPDFRAAAPHSGGTMADLSSCKTGHMPIIIFHGTGDPLIADNCDDPEAAADPGFMASATLWAMKNGCKTTYQTMAVSGSDPNSKGSCYVYDGCPADGQVEMCAFMDMPHCWAGAPVCQGCIGEGPGYASATHLEWDFFKKYAW